MCGGPWVVLAMELTSGHRYQLKTAGWQLAHASANSKLLGAQGSTLVAWQLPAGQRFFRCQLA